MKDYDRDMKRAIEEADRVTFRRPEAAAMSASESRKSPGAKDNSAGIRKKGVLKLMIGAVIDIIGIALFVAYFVEPTTSEEFWGGLILVAIMFLVGIPLTVKGTASLSSRK
jgi:hypothetical protein